MYIPYFYAKANKFLHKKDKSCVWFSCAFALAYLVRFFMVWWCLQMFRHIADHSHYSVNTLEKGLSVTVAYFLRKLERYSRYVGG